MSDVPDGWADELRSGRREKDEFFAEHRQSPIPPEDRETFDGLDYFEPAPEFRVEAEITAHDDPAQLELDTSDGRSIRYDRVVTFTFEVDGEPVEIHGYRQPEEEEPADAPIFVPFRDKTTGPQTYEKGRYMELETGRALESTAGTSSDEASAPGALETGDTVPIDFNLAYSPFCAYSETFSCPLPPEENWLDVAIEAGEKGRV